MRIAIILLSLLSSPALAQQPPSVAEMRAAVSASMAQTDAIRNLHIQAEAKAGALAEENARLKAKVRELENKTPDASPAPQQGDLPPH